MNSRQSIFGVSIRGAVKCALLGASVAAMTGVVASAATDVNGQVNVTGHVTGVCFVVNGEAISSTFSGTIDLGELAGSNGKLNPTLTGTTISGASLNFSVVCNSATPRVSMSATAMVGSAATVLTGYTKTIDYTAKLVLQKADSTTQTFTYATFGSPSATAGNLTAALSGNPNNVTVSVNSLVTNGNLLAAGNYGAASGGSGGVISITITPA